MDITVYTKPDCRQCDMTKSLLDKEKLEYSVADVYEPENLKLVTDLGYSGAPIVVLSTGEHWYGFRPDLIKDLSVRVHHG